MANRRMISKSISTSKKLMKVSDFAALLFSWLIPHCDDYGHMDGSPEMVRGIVVPLRNKTIEEVKNALEELEAISLLKIYEVNGDRYLEIIKWGDFQTFKNDRPLNMEYPIPLESSGIREIPLSDSSKVKISKDKIYGAPATPSHPISIEEEYTRLSQEKEIIDTDKPTRKEKDKRPLKILYKLAAKVKEVEGEDMVIENSQKPVAKALKYLTEEKLWEVLEDAVDNGELRKLKWNLYLLLSDPKINEYKIS